MNESVPKGNVGRACLQSVCYPGLREPNWVDHSLVRVEFDLTAARVDAEGRGFASDIVLEFLV